MSEALLAVASAAPLTQLSEDEKLFQETIRQFARETIQPLVRSMDEEQHFADGLVAQFFDLGLMGIEIPEEYGGSGGTFFQAILAVEELSAVDPSVGVLVDVQNTLCVNALVRWGSAEQKKHFLRRLAKDMVCSYALSEASSGSDAFALQMRADKRGDDFVLNGQKLWITNSHEAGLFIVFATIDRAAGYKGITAFLVEKGMPGFKIGKKEDKLGIPRHQRAN
jgi:alkylation response protein AidB-like acyl-CoA dehydrogenase